MLITFIRNRVHIDAVLNALDFNRIWQFVHHLLESILMDFLHDFHSCFSFLHIRTKQILLGFHFILCRGFAFVFSIFLQIFEQRSQLIFQLWGLYLGDIFWPFHCETSHFLRTEENVSIWILIHYFMFLNVFSFPQHSVDNRKGSA